jgi:hypothetical protein
MATTTYLSNPVVTVNSVDLTDQCTAATINRTFEALESTAFGDTSRKYTAGLQVLEVTLTLYMTYAATETYATLKALVGTTTNLTVKPSAGAPSPTSPELIVTGAYLETLPVISATMGELSTIDITFTGGTYAEVTAGP